jgi:hypothetical protein
VLEEDCKFKARLGYQMSSRSAWATQQEPVLKKKKIVVPLQEFNYKDTINETFEYFLKISGKLNSSVSLSPRDTAPALWSYYLMI